jgi:hypothetical protein
LVEHQLGRVVDTMIAATASRCGRAVFVLAEQALDLGADLRLGRAAVAQSTVRSVRMLSTSSWAIVASAGSAFMSSTPPARAS